MGDTEWASDFAAGIRCTARDTVAPSAAVLMSTAGWMLGSCAGLAFAQTLHVLHSYLLRLFPAPLGCSFCCTTYLIVSDEQQKMATGECVATLEGHSKSVESVA